MSMAELTAASKTIWKRLIVNQRSTRSPSWKRGTMTPQTADDLAALGMSEQQLFDRQSRVTEMLKRNEPVQEDQQHTEESFVVAKRKPRSDRGKPRPKPQPAPEPEQKAGGIAADKLTWFKTYPQRLAEKREEYAAIERELLDMEAGNEATAIDSLMPSDLCGPRKRIAIRKGGSGGPDRSGKLAMQPTGVIEQ